MARKPRLHVPGGLYHVILRGNAGQDIFFAPEDRSQFYALVSEGVARFGYRVHAFCLMTNHVHLALQAAETPLSRGLQNLAFRYTRYINARRKRVGHLFQGRFQAYLVDQDSYGLALVRYIHLNPVRAGLVKDAAAYPYSSHRAYLGRAELGWLTTDWMLGQFAARLSAARARFAQFVDAGKAQGHSEAFYGGQADSRVVGEEDFLKKVLKSERETSKPLPLDEIVAYVCKSAGLTLVQLEAPDRNRRSAQARTLIAWLAVRSHSCTLAQVAERFARSPSTLSHLVTRLDKLAQRSVRTDEALRRHLSAMMQA